MQKAAYMHRQDRCGKPAGHALAGPCAKAAQNRARATVMTLYVMATDIGAALGPFLGYLMAELWGTAAMYQAAALWLAALGLWWLVAGRRGDLQ